MLLPVLWPNIDTNVIKIDLETELLVVFTVIFRLTSHVNLTFNLNKMLFLCFHLELKLPVY